MSAACLTIDLDAPLVQAVLEGADCHLNDLVRAGYEALFTPRGEYLALLVAMATITVALAGYRLMLGLGEPRLSGLTLLVVKLGVVLALASHWPAYQTVVYRALGAGPVQLADAVLLRFNEGEDAAGVFQRLQEAVDILSIPAPPAPPTTIAQATGQLVQSGLDVGSPTGAPTVETEASPASTPGAPVQSTTIPTSASLKSAAMVLLFATLGPVLAAKTALSVLLAVGPLFIACLLFEPTAGLFIGWVRACVSAALTPMASIVVTALGLAMLRPWLETLSQPALSQPSPDLNSAVVILVGLIVLMSLGGVLAMVAVGSGIGVRRFMGALDGAGDSRSRLGDASANVDERIVRGMTQGLRSEESRHRDAQAGERRISIGASRDAPSAGSVANARAASISRLGQGGRRGPAPRTDGIAKARSRRTT